MRRDLIALSVCLALSLPNFAASGLRPMALMVFFDGARADLAFTEICPNIRSLITDTWAEGYHCAWSDAGQNIFDARTLSYPNHSSILCGVTAAKHHVLNNDQVRTKGDKHGWPTWCKRLVTARPELKARAFFADSNDARIMPDPAVPMIVAHDKDWRTRDESTTCAAVDAYCRVDAPDAGLFFLEELDSFGHYCGYYPTSEDYQESYTASDARFGRVLAAIKSRPTFAKEDWMIVFTSDHGGKLLGHGWDDGHCHTVPLLVVGRQVAHGVLPGCPRTYDLAPTLLAHFGVGTEGMDGAVIGSVAQRVDDHLLDEGLVCYEPFEVSGPRTINVKPGERVTSRWGYTDHLFTGLTATSAAGASPVSTSYGRVAGRDVSAAFRLEGSTAAFCGEKPSFTLTFWMLDEGEAYGEDPIILGNKNIFCFQNHGFQENDKFPGFAIFLRTKGDDGNCGVTLKYTLEDGRTVRPLGAFIPERGRWNFYAISVHADCKVLFYQGRCDGRLHWMAADCHGAKWASGGPLMIGQDVTGQYANGADLCFDELRIWSRSLSTEEIRKVFAMNSHKSTVVD